MKALVVIIVVVVIGGGVAALWFLGIPPFGKPAAPHKKADAGQAKADKKDLATTEATAASALTPPSRSKTVAQKPATPPAEPDPERDARLARLSSTYEQMSPEDAGRIFTKLPDSLVENLLRKMDEGKVAKLLLALPVERAAKLTLALSK
jgi:flagellar motility protein MotE (MotC chaperone)